MTLAVLDSTFSTQFSRSDGTVADVTLTGGGTLSTPQLMVGTQTGSNGSLTVSDGTVTSDDEFTVGRYGQGTMLVESDGSVETALMIIGSYPSGVGEVTVDGGSWDYTGAWAIGWDGVERECSCGG